MTAAITYFASMLLMAPFNARVVATDEAIEFSKVSRLVTELQASSHWVARKKAAHQLREIDWRQHPEAVEVLTVALKCDPKGFVRSEAAESLGRIKPCLPAAHEALDAAARGDRCLLAKLAAKKALKGLDRSCLADCDVCETETLVPVSANLELEGPTDSSGVPAGVSTTLEPLDSTSVEIPVLPPAPSPFTPSVEPEFAKRPPVGSSPVRREDSMRLSPPMVPIDRYDPRPGEPAPTPLGDDAVAPKPTWTGVVPD